MNDLLPLFYYQISFRYNHFFGPLTWFELEVLESILIRQWIGVWMKEVEFLARIKESILIIYFFRFKNLNKFVRVKNKHFGGSV